MFSIIIALNILSYVLGGPATESYKDQYCTDPRTMKKQAAYTEWADAYSCSRHRCQPGGRNLAIYTVGCKRVEAPESAIECEEVVEDTNMQFPYCCTRLRCLVVVRGEVWTRVLGQPWETLPAAPWSHMYKMKKPPPGDANFLPKTEQGPIFELSDTESEGAQKILRSGKKAADGSDCNEGIVPRAAQPPDIVIALSTNKEHNDHNNNYDNLRHTRGRKTPHVSSQYFEEDKEHNEAELSGLEDVTLSTEKPPDASSDEKYYANAFGVTQKVPFKAHHQVAWTEIPENQWNDHDPFVDADSNKDANSLSETSTHEPDKEDKPSNLQALVDAIGTRMRDIESVVQHMSDKVHHAKPGEPDFADVGSIEKRSEMEHSKSQIGDRNHHDDGKDEKVKQPSPDGEHYKRFSVRNRGSKYLHGTADSTTEQPLFVDDTNMNGYFSDASNSVLRRANLPKEPASTYMAPVDTRRKTPTHIPVSDTSEDVEKKRKKHGHKKKKGKGHGHKKHRKDEKRKHFNRLTSSEVDKNAVSLEDSSAIASKN